jgi:hypothetical protein
MIDQLHQFDTIAAATAAFPWPKGDNGKAMSASVWNIPGAAVMISDVQLLAPALDTTDEETGAAIRGTVAASGVWIGLATDDAALAETLRGLPSFRLEYERPQTPTPWRDAVTHHAEGVDIAALPVASAGSYAGSGYVFD